MAQPTTRPNIINRLKYIFGPYFCQNYSIWSLFLLFDQFGPHFCKIAFNRVLLVNSIKIVNGIVTQWNCIADVARYAFFLTDCLFNFNNSEKRLLC